MKLEVINFTLKCTKFLGVFCALGLSGLAPGLHYILSDDIRVTLFYASWLILMAAFYIGGAIIYALRIPERFLPGYFDLWVGKILQLDIEF